MEVHGKVHYVDKKERLFSILVNGNLQYYHLTNKYMKDYKAYLYKKPYVSFEANDEFCIHSNIKCQEVDHFIKIAQPTRRGTTIYYDLQNIQSSVKDLINQDINRMFLDLEFSLPSPNGYSISEIIQYGIVLEDKNGKIIYQGSNFVKPVYSNYINRQTMNFLSIDNSVFDDAVTYIEFYQLLERLIKEFNPKIIAWGRNDCLSIEKSFKINHLKPLDIRSRYMNLMHVIKNYYNYKQEMGLFNTYQDMTKTDLEKQTHDALEDAVVERNIFHLFKEEINKTNND